MVQKDMVVRGRGLVYAIIATNPYPKDQKLEVEG